MATTDPLSTFTPSLFKIIAGPNQKHLMVDTSLLCQSLKMRALVQGPWRETQEQEIEWTQWSEETVGRYLGWLYTEDYSCPFPTPVEKHGKDDTEPVESENLGQDELSDTASTASMLDSKPEEDGFTPPIKLSGSEAFEQWARSCVKSPHEYDYRVPCLVHAELYALADYLLLPDLRRLALYRLQRTLIFVGFVAPRTRLLSNLISLLQFTYANTHNRTDQEEPLRKLVSNFAASNPKILIERDLQLLLGEGGDLAADLLAKITPGLLEFQDQTSVLKEENRKLRLDRDQLVHHLKDMRSEALELCKQRQEMRAREDQLLAELAWR